MSLFFSTETDNEEYWYECFNNNDIAETVIMKKYVYNDMTNVIIISILIMIDFL